MASRDFEFPTVQAPGKGPRPVPDPAPQETPIEPGEPGGFLAEVLQAGGDVDLYLARHRPRRVTSVPATYRIPLDLAQVLKTWVGEDPEHRTSTGLIVALLDAWARDSGLRVGESGQSA